MNPICYPVGVRVPAGGALFRFGINDEVHQLPARSKYVQSRTDREDQRMKHLLTGAAMVAALAISAPVWAQPANPSGGNSMGMPGPSPGGPGLTPYSSGQS